MLKIIALILFNIRKVKKRVMMILYRKLFKKIGNNVIFDPYDSFSFKTISIGDDVFIGSGASFSASDSAIEIGDKVMFGPNVTIMGGDHNTSQLGKYMFDVKDKAVGDDLPVFVESDVWIGANVTILKGVTIATGSIVAAGAVVTKSFPEYSIIAGVPAVLVKDRFSKEALSQHKKLMGKN